jgi:uncharacterized protein YggE
MTFNTHVTALACAMLLTTSARPQAAGNLLYDANNRIFFQQAEHPVKASVHGNVLVLEVNAMMNVQADSYLAIFHLSQVGQTAAEVDSLMNQRIGSFLKRVERDGIRTSEVFVDMLSFVPVFELEETRKLFSRAYQEVPAGFEIQKNVHLRFTDPRVLDKLVSAAAREEIYDLVKVDYYVRDQGARYDTLRTFAQRTMQQKLDHFAKLGLKVAESHRTGGETNGAHFPLERYTRYQSNSRMSLNSRRKGQVVNDVRKPSTLFYNKVPYSHFDLVLHPEITEPPVQFTYHLVLHCQLPPQASPKEVREMVKYVLLNEKGELKELRLP